jgi:hypothetical protein
MSTASVIQLIVGREDSRCSSGSAPGATIRYSWIHDEEGRAVGVANLDSDGEPNHRATGSEGTRRYAYERWDDSSRRDVDASTHTSTRSPRRPGWNNDVDW